MVVIGQARVRIRPLPIGGYAALKMSDFDELTAQARRQARKAGLKRSDVAPAVTAEKKAK